jgi:hypothetical protein
VTEAAPAEGLKEFAAPKEASVSGLNVTEHPTYHYDAPYEAHGQILLELVVQSPHHAAFVNGEVVDAVHLIHAPEVRLDQPYSLVQNLNPATVAATVAQESSVAAAAVAAVARAGLAVAAAAAFGAALVEAVGDVAAAGQVQTGLSRDAPHQKVVDS